MPRRNPQLFLAGACIALAIAAHGQTPLTDHAFERADPSTGAVLLHVNWGRFWKCGQYENAQLQRLSFRRISESAGKDWTLEPRSNLLALPAYEQYAFIVDAGEYGLSGFRLKVAASVNDVRIAEPDASVLMKDGKAVGGTFAVAPGEIVYVGHFGVGCAGDPTLWRLYIDGRSAFEAYVADFHARFPATKNTSVTFRLFQSEFFGNAYELPE